MTWEAFIQSDFSDIKGDEKCEELLDYLKAEEEDGKMVFACAKAAYEYIVSAVGSFDEDDSTAVMLLKAITQDFYDNRVMKDPRASLTQPFQRISYINTAILLQLKLKYDLSKESS